MITRRQWVAGVVSTALAGTAVDALAIEPQRVEVARHCVGGRDA